MLPPIPAGWKAQLGDEATKPYYRELDAFLDHELADGQTVLPAREDIFNALKFTPCNHLKVLLLGQDPYPNPGDAHGLCFSVQPQLRKLPASLKNIFKELHTDVGFRVPNNGHLEYWARQGILMLNTVLTVRAHEPNSHRTKKPKGQRWEIFTDRIIEQVNARPTRVVFLLWGNQAQEKSSLITGSHHAIIKCAHPSPLSARKFFGCRCFSRTNQHLTEAGLAPIDWQIADV